MSALPAPVREPTGSHAAVEWDHIGQAAPQLAATMRRYLTQVAAFLAPRSVEVADSSLRQLSRWILASTGIESVAGIRRDDIEDYKVWLARQPGTKGALSANTHRQRLRTLRAFFERIIE
jgi:site-specific recombinase XerD